MRLSRRDLLGGTAMAGSTLALARPAAAAPQRAADVTGNTAGALPMPAPRTQLPARLPQHDPGRILVDRGWRFHEGDVVTPPPKTHHDTYLATKAGNAGGAAAVDFDDSDWAEVVLPHDWASHQPFVESANVSQGYRPRGIGWYRRALVLDEADRGKRIELQFGGIATDATIWVNGSVVAHSWSAYTGDYLDITPFARFGGEPNIVAVRVDAEAMEGWWYEGAGLYRHVWLTVRPPIAIATDGVHCDPRRDAQGRWSVPVVVRLDGARPDEQRAEITARLIDPDGKTIGTATAQGRTDGYQGGEVAMTIPVADPRLWSPARPVLYRVEVELAGPQGETDRRHIAVGFRTIRFDPQAGLFLNERPLKIKGVCLHQDHAGVGVAVPDDLWRWRLERLKAMGCNAIRCAHGAPAAELLDWCDRLGLLVMDENRRFNPAPVYLAQLEWLVRRDRNHPSIILWSVFNEEPMQGTDEGVRMVRRMVAAVERLDSSRPVTAAMNGAFFDPVNVAQVTEVTGFNYYQGDYDRYHALNPAQPMTSSEDTSAYMTRGAFRTDAAAHVASSYDTESASWGASHREAWRMIDTRAFVAGGFVWTGFDYHGEPTPYAWPTVSSYFGILDLCGFPKTAFDIHRANWIDDSPVVAVFPHWTWPGREGEPIKVMAMSNAERLELRLNGKVVGRAAVDRYMGNSWDVPYAPGRIEIAAYRGDQIVARAAHETAGAPVASRLTPARTVMSDDPEDAQPVTIDAIDAHGRHVPIANIPVQFAITGAEIIGVGNGDPTSHESEKAPRRSLFNGLAQLIVQSGENRGPILLRAEAEGLKPAQMELRREAVPARPRAAVPDLPMMLDRWRRSPAFVDAPSPDLAPSDGDNNSWAFVHAGTPTPAGGGGRFRLYRTVFNPRARVARAGGLITFGRVAGAAQLWLDGQPIAHKDDAAPGPLSVAIPPGAGPRSLVVRIEADPGTASGITGPVTIRSNRN